MPLTVLITGFGPFPGAPFNPTAALAENLARRRRPALSEVRRIAHVFPTSYAAVERELPDLIARYRPDLVLLFGLAPRTPHVRIEGSRLGCQSMPESTCAISPIGARWSSRASTADGCNSCTFPTCRERTRAGATRPESDGASTKPICCAPAKRSCARCSWPRARSRGDARRRLRRSARVPIPLQLAPKPGSRQSVNGPCRHAG